MKSELFSVLFSDIFPSSRKVLNQRRGISKIKRFFVVVVVVVVVFVVVFFDENV